MYQNKKILAVIPARGGSKGIPKKNITMLDGLPLIVYTLKSAQHSKYLDRIIVSTEDFEIKKVAEQYGGEVPFLRPVELAQDDSKTIDCILHTIDILKNIRETYDYVVILQCTSPLRKSWHIDEAIVRIISENGTSLVSVSEVEEHPILMRTLNTDGTLQNLLNVNSTIRRQNFPSFYKVDGAIYIQKIDENLNKDTSLNDGKLAYIMDRKYTVDIDEYLDIRKVELYLKELHNLKIF
ncbi:N-acylneuraminate cytidylyltransferase [Fusobacterium necrophorum]|nr:acylneuraminate cytidylyltransferase family protein [Fusobacterium necrophorum]MBR8823451.1 N-acylneuraminate cytidylyltransferase [Fusobacterium necrophorum]